MLTCLDLISTPQEDDLLSESLIVCLEEETEKQLGGELLQKVTDSIWGIIGDKVFFGMYGQTARDIAHQRGEDLIWGK